MSLFMKRKLLALTYLVFEGELLALTYLVFDGELLALAYIGFEGTCLFKVRIKMSSNSPQFILFRPSLQI